LKVKEIVKLLKAEVHCKTDDCGVEITKGGASDLMSDVLAYLTEMPESRSTCMITGLLSPQVIRTASLTDVPVIIFTRGKKPTPAMVEQAKEAELCVLSTNYTSFTCCGLLWDQGVRGVDKTD